MNMLVRTPPKPDVFTILETMLFISGIAIFLIFVCVIIKKLYHILHSDRSLTYLDYDRITHTNEVKVVTTNFGTRDAIMLFNNLGGDFYNTMEKILKKTTEFVAFMQTLDPESDQYQKSLLIVVNLADVMDKLTTEACIRIKERIYIDNNTNFVCQCDTELLVNYCTLANLLYDQYHTTREYTFIPSEISYRCNEIYHKFFELFDLINKNIKIR